MIVVSFERFLIRYVYIIRAFCRPKYKKEIKNNKKIFKLRLDTGKTLTLITIFTFSCPRGAAFRKNPLYHHLNVKRLTNSISHAILLLFYLTPEFLVRLSYIGRPLVFYAVRKFVKLLRSVNFEVEITTSFYYYLCMALFFFVHTHSVTDTKGGLAYLNYR